MAGVWYRLRILTVHIIYITYSSLLWWKLISIGSQTNHPESETKVAFGIWASIYLLVTCFLCYFTIGGSPPDALQLTWCNVPMLVFIVFNLPPFGFTLKHMYELAEDKKVLNHTSSAETQLPMGDVILLQMVMPVLLVTFIIYPLPQRAYTSSEYLAIAVEFMNAFDIMDMVTDVSYVQKYDTVWIVLFYLSLGTSAVLVAFPVKIENEDIAGPRKFIICAHSELNINQNNMGMSMSMTSILDAPFVIETDYKTERRVSISPGVYADEKDVTQKNRSKSEPRHNESLNEKRESTSVKERLSTAEKAATEDDKKDSSPSLTMGVWRKVIKAVLTMLFMDTLFACIRFKIMISENSADYGFNMFMKNLILATLHLSFLVKHVKSLIIAKLEKVV